MITIEIQDKKGLQNIINFPQLSRKEKEEVIKEIININLKHNNLEEYSIISEDFFLAEEIENIEDLIKKIKLKITKDFFYLNFALGALYVLQKYISLKNKDDIYSLNSFLKQEYKEEILETIKSENLNFNVSLDWKRDFYYSYPAARILFKRYLMEEELPQHLFLSTAIYLSQREKPKTKEKFVKKAYELLSERKISLSTPLLRNSRLKNYPNLTSCFILELGDSIEELFNGFKEIAKLSQEGGGVGVYLSNIRGRGSSIRGVKNSSQGVIPWIKIVNDISLAVNQSGLRKGAITVALDVWHIDIENFLEIQLEYGDFRFKSFDIFPQVVIPNLFMKFLLEEKKWYCLDPHEIDKKFGIKLSEVWGKEFEDKYLEIIKNIDKLENVKEVDPKVLLKKIIKTQVETGLPYIVFKDNINENNPNIKKGTIKCVNLCVESFSNFSKDFIHSCNLASICIDKIKEFKELKQVVYWGIRILDNSLELSEVPGVIETKRHNECYRTVGLGIMGLHDFLLKKNKSYKDKEFIDKIMAYFSLFSKLSSFYLGKEKGNFPFFKDSIYQEGTVFFSFEDEIKERLAELNEPELLRVYNFLKKNLRKHLRNSHINAIAPNSSTSIIMDSSPSIFPYYASIYIYNVEHGNLIITSKDQKASETVLSLAEQLDFTKSIQKWIDTGISFEVVLDPSLEGYNAKNIFDFIVDCWKNKIKTIYYVRFRERDYEPPSSNRSKRCLSCSG